LVFNRLFIQGAEVASIVQSVNSRIQIRRARFSVVQEREIQLAWQNLDNLDYNKADAVDARSELDLRIGAVFTRFQTLGLKNRFEELQDKKVISYGKFKDF
jgi:DNA topoisomerase-3